MGDCKSVPFCSHEHGLLASRNDSCEILLTVWFNDLFWDVLILRPNNVESRVHSVSSLEDDYECTDQDRENRDEVLASLKYSRIKKKSLKENGICAKNVVMNFETESIYFCVFLKELRCSNVYRSLVINYTFNCLQKKGLRLRKCIVIQCQLKENLPRIIDYDWNTRVSRSALERQHLDTAMSWLSTLGGACSALGDYDLHFAKRAGNISYQQMGVAVRIGDPAVVSRCRLYIAISLIQQCNFKVIYHFPIFYYVIFDIT